MLEAGVPPGVLHVVHGSGTEAGAALVAHPDVDLVSFTGSCGVGRDIQRVAGARLAKVSLELGGKNPLIVCDDADLPTAARAAVLSAFSNAGQRCAAGSRIIVFDAVHDEFSDLLLEATAALKIGSGDDDDVGPVLNERQLDRMLDALTAAVGGGAKLLAGGRRVTAPPLADGYYLEPTVVSGVGGDDPISTTELFGPVACLYRVADFDAALDLANASPYGLTASIHSASIHRAMEFAQRIQAGMAVVNGPTYGSEPHMPFGGFKQSGNGSREAGTEALDVFSDWKNVSIIHDPSRT
jgi:aldehyde dehydrogenase (NAD+)